VTAIVEETVTAIIAIATEIKTVTVTGIIVIKIVENLEVATTGKRGRGVETDLPKGGVAAGVILPRDAAVNVQHPQGEAGVAIAAIRTKPIALIPSTAETRAEIAAAAGTLGI